MKKEFKLDEKQKEMLKEIIIDFRNNQNRKVFRCKCCEWRYFILPFAWKYLSQKDEICDDCKRAGGKFKLNKIQLKWKKK